MGTRPRAVPGPSSREQPSTPCAVATEGRRSRAGPLTASLQHVLPQDLGAPGEVRLLLRFRTQSTSSRESQVTSSGRNPQQSPCQEQEDGARRKGWRCRQSGRKVGARPREAQRGARDSSCGPTSTGVAMSQGSRLGPPPPATRRPLTCRLGAHCEPTDSIRCHGPEHTTGTHGLRPLPILSHQGPLSLSPRHGQQISSCSPRDVLPLTPRTRDSDLGWRWGPRRGH